MFANSTDMQNAPLYMQNTPIGCGAYFEFARGEADPLFSLQF
jgi:hypothetical protein